MRKIAWFGPLLIVVGLLLGGAMAFGVYKAEADARVQITPETMGPLPLPAPITLQAEAGDAVRGHDLYGKTCAGCHGTLGNSDKPLHGPLLNVYYPDDGVLAAIIRNGIGSMPATDTDRLSDQGIADIITYIRTFP